MVRLSEENAVTLIHKILQDYPDKPEDYTGDSYPIDEWVIEALRRAWTGGQEALAVITQAQTQPMCFDPATGKRGVFPVLATQYRTLYRSAWLFDPWNGKPRDAETVAMDVFGTTINHW